jgi:hypothetical protein
MALAREARLKEEQQREQREQRARQRMSQSAVVATGGAGRRRSLASPRISRAAMTPPSTPPPAERKSRVRAVRGSLRAQGSYPDLRTVFGAPESPPMPPTPLPWFLPRDNGLPPRTNPLPSFSPFVLFRSLLRATLADDHAT